MKKTRSGECRVCGRTFNLTNAGNVRHHLMPKRPNQPTYWYRSPVCDGAGEQPAPRENAS